MKSLINTNNWTPSIYTSTSPVNWTEERARAYRIGGGCKQSLKANAKEVSRTSYKK